MGRCKKFEGGKIDEKVRIDSLHVSKLKKFIKKLLKLSHKDRYEYIKSISNREIKFIEEIIYNILRGTIPLTYNTYNKLKRVKKQLYSMIEENSPKEVLYSLKGLRILSVILPIVLSYLT